MPVNFTVFWGVMQCNLVQVHLRFGENTLFPSSRLTFEHTWTDNKVRKLIAVEVPLLTITVVLQSTTPLGKLCTDASALFTLQNKFGTGFVE
jgi:hypothetical protein